MFRIRDSSFFTRSVKKIADPDPVGKGKKLLQFKSFFLYFLNLFLESSKNSGEKIIFSLYPQDPDPGSGSVLVFGSDPDLDPLKK